LQRVAGNPEWTLSSEKTVHVCKEPGTHILEEDLRLNIRQKGVDMKIGLDIASLALKKMVDH